MKAVILAAGEGRRMRPLTEARPKAMLTVAGKPIAERLICEAAAAGIRDFVFVVGYLGERIRDYFGDGGRWGVHITYCVQDNATGTAAALGLAGQAVAGPFLVANGDSIVLRADIARLMSLGESQIGVKEVEYPERYGAVEFAGDRVARIYEKSLNPPSTLANAGIYLFTQKIFEAIAATSLSVRGEYELTAAINSFINNGGMMGYCRVDSWREISYQWDLLSVGEELMTDLDGLSEGVIQSGVTISGGVRVGADSIIRTGTYISGPVIIGNGCDIGPNCYIRASSVIGDGCRIGAGVEIKNSVVMSGTKIPHLSYIGDSVIGENCNLGAGTNVANMRLDGGEVEVRGVPTGRRKLGVVMGDGVRTGINACLNPGTVIGGGAWIGPGAVACGDIAPGARVFAPAKPQAKRESIE